MNPLSKTFRIIETIVFHQDSGLSYTDIVSLTGLPKATVHRLLKDLIELGYLGYNQETKKYFGSLKLAALGAEVVTNFHLRDHIRPHLLELHKKTGHTTNLGIKSGMSGVFVDKVESMDYGIKLFSEIGKHFPLHCTGLGKVLLAFSTPEEREEVLSQPLDAYTEFTISDPEALEKELNTIRERGYAFDNQEITRGIMCVAAPILGVDDKLICGISIAFPSYIREDRELDSEIRAITRQASQISGNFRKNELPAK
jgi:IclR family KDG regulon transcriptional repressor